MTLDATIVGYPALIGLADFSHVWLLFVFHNNTNSTVNGVVEEKPTAPKATANEASAQENNSLSEKGVSLIRFRDSEGVGDDDDDEPARWGDGAREYHPTGYKLRQTFLTKVW